MHKCTAIDCLVCCRQRAAAKNTAAPWDYKTETVKHVSPHAGAKDRLPAPSVLNQRPKDKHCGKIFFGDINLNYEY